VSKLPDLFTEAGSPLPPEPAPREILLAALDTDELRKLAAYHDVQVLTTGPGTAIALFRTVHGSLVATAQARTAGDRIFELTVLR